MVQQNDEKLNFKRLFTDSAPSVLAHSTLLTFTHLIQDDVLSLQRWKLGTIRGGPQT